MSDELTETRLAHFEMQEAAAWPTGDWRLAIHAASLELARFIGKDSEMAADHRRHLIELGAALLVGSQIVGLPDDADDGAPWHG